MVRPYTEKMVQDTAGSPAITEWLRQWSAGDPAAAEQVLSRVYGELRRIAARHLRRERGEHTLQATAIVHETYLRLAGENGLRFPSRVHFFAFAAHLIRRILVDHARLRRRAKRGGDLQRITLSEVDVQSFPQNPDLVALDDALKALGSLDPRKAAVVEMRFFAGLSLEETADQLGISAETVGREWRRAKAWLYEELRPAEGR
jgi:RNA polymerase sigma factor (TIGR02999 family)